MIKGPSEGFNSETLKITISHQRFYFKTSDPNLWNQVVQELFPSLIADENSIQTNELLIDSQSVEIEWKKESNYFDEHPTLIYHPAFENEKNSKSSCQEMEVDKKGNIKKDDMEIETEIYALKP